MIGVLDGALHGMGDAHHGLERPAEELLLRQHAGPGIEELHGVGAGVDLVDEMIDHGVDQKIDQQAEGIGVGDRPSSLTLAKSWLPPPSIM